jgi:hypothetical protein
MTFVYSDMAMLPTLLTWFNLVAPTLQPTQLKRMQALISGRTKHPMKFFFGTHSFVESVLQSVYRGSFGVTKTVVNMTVIQLRFNRFFPHMKIDFDNITESAIMDGPFSQESCKAACYLCTLMSRLDLPNDAMNKLDFFKWHHELARSSEKCCFFDTAFLACTEKHISAKALDGKWKFGKTPITLEEVMSPEATPIPQSNIPYCPSPPRLSEEMEEERPASPSYEPTPTPPRTASPTQIVTKDLRPKLEAIRKLKKTAQRFIAAGQGEGPLDLDDEVMCILDLPRSQKPADEEYTVNNCYSDEVLMLDDFVFEPSPQPEKPKGRHR